MGRTADFIALNTAIASGAESVLIPEEHTDIEKVAIDLKEQNKGSRGSIVIVAEGDDGGGAKEIMDKVAPLMPGYTLRHSVLGHIQRGGNPSAFDRMLATRMGAYAVQLIIEGKSNVMIGSRGDDLQIQPLNNAITFRAPPALSPLALLASLRPHG